MLEVKYVDSDSTKVRITKIEDVITLRYKRNIVISDSDYLFNTLLPAVRQISSGTKTKDKSYKQVLKENKLNLSYIEEHEILELLEFAYNNYR